MSDKIELMSGVQLWRNKFKMSIFRLHYAADPIKGQGEKTFVPELNMWLSPWALGEYTKATDKAYYLQENEIDFGATSGSVIYSLQEEFTLEDEFIVPAHWTRYMALDPHPGKPHAALWLAVDPYDEWHVYREYWPSPLCFRWEGGRLLGSSASVTDKERAVGIEQYVECLKLLESKDNPQNGFHAERIYKRVIDYAARGFGQSDKSGPTDSNFQKEFENAAEAINFDLTFEDAKKDREVGYMAVNQALKPRTIEHPMQGTVQRSKLRIMRQRCPELVWQLKHNRRRKQTAQQLENEDPIVKAQKKRNDLTDDLRYLVNANPEYIEPIDPETESTWIPANRGIGY